MSHNFYFLLNNTRRINVTARNVTTEAGFMDRKFPDHKITSFDETGSYQCVITEEGENITSKSIFYQIPGKNNKK